MEPLFEQCSRNLHIRVFENARMEIINRIDGTVWLMSETTRQEDGRIAVGTVWYRKERSVAEGYIARFRVSRENDLLRYTVLDCAGSVRGTFLCSIRLEDDALIFNIPEISPGLESLSFPTAIQSESLLLTHNQGQWIRNPVEGFRFHCALGEGTTMRWFGGLRGEKGWIGIFHQGVEDAGLLVSELNAAPVWLKSLGTWRGNREIRYQFTENGNYVRLAKIFRRYAMQNGLFRSLKDKIAHVPSVSKIVRGRDVYFCQSEPVIPDSTEEYDALCTGMRDASSNTLPTRIHMTHAQVADKIRELEEMGFDGLIQIGGWLNSGYDGRYPDIYPFNNQLGSEEEFAAVFQSSSHFAIGLHDNYQDIYRISPSFPHGVIVNENGFYMRGGVWGHQAFILNSRNSMAYQRRNWEHLKHLGAQFVYADTICAAAFYESFEPGNTLTRAQDRECKEQLMRFYKDQGLILGTETGMDFGIPYVDWLASNMPHIMGESVPLFGLVYHDAVVNGNGSYDSFNNLTQEGSYPDLLKMIVWGDSLHYWVVGEDGWQEYLCMAENSRYLDNWYASIATEEMVSHRYLTPDGSVEQSVFSSGHTATVNFTAAEIVAEGLTLPPYGYILSGPSA